MNRAARRRLLWTLALALVVVAAAVILLMPAPGQGIASGPPPLNYVGVTTCEECHAEETARWRASHHAFSLQEASEKTVLGDFADARISLGASSARFFRRAGGFFVRTDGPEGRVADYAVRYTIGVFPVQQYLLAMPGGRYQALGFAWDARPRQQGGQRWLALYPDERAGHLGVVHWTKATQNWNSECAECHSTNVHKGYRLAPDEFATTFATASVSCEACHGPGSRHVSWARSARARGRPAAGDPGLVVRFGERRGRSWQLDVVRGTARPTGAAPETRLEVETCARCHARRRLLTEEYWPGHLLAATHRPALLDEGLYTADGQIAGRDYEWGSFLQSGMYAAGVTCADCHDAHDQKLKVGSDEVCASCHQPEKFATRRHHFHREGSKGASCVACHMPALRDMAVDERHDHSLRVPRPDLTLALGERQAPNACNGCHRDRSPRWAAAALRRFFPNGRSNPEYATAIALGRSGGPGAERALVSVFHDPKLPGIARATAISLLPAHRTPASLPALQKAATDKDPLLRLAAASVLRALSPKERLRVGVTLLWDPVRAVRIEAVPAFADVPDAELASEQRAAFDRALDDYLLAQRANAERPEAHVNVGVVFARRGRLDEARRAYQAALRLAPWYVPALVELAALDERQGRLDEGEALLRKALREQAESATLHEALGQLLARRGRRVAAEAELRRAAELDPRNPRRTAAYAQSLLAQGRLDEALALLRAAVRQHAGSRELLFPLVSICRQQGAQRESAAWTRQLLLTNPDDPEARALGGALAAEVPPSAR